MRLYEALKRAKLLAGEISVLSNQVQLCAQWKKYEDNNIEEKPERDAKVSLTQLLEKKNELATLKGRIAAANAPIQGKLALLGELKEVAKIVTTLQNQRLVGQRSTEEGYTRNGHELVPVIKRIIMVSAFSITELDELLAKTQADIQELEAAINAHNYTTTL